MFTTLLLLLAGPIVFGVSLLKMSSSASIFLATSTTCLLKNILLSNHTSKYLSFSSIVSLKFCSMKVIFYCLSWLPVSGSVARVDGNSAVIFMLSWGWVLLNGRQVSTRLSFLLPQKPTWLLRHKETGAGEGQYDPPVQLPDDHFIEQRSENTASLAQCQLPPSRDTGCLKLTRARAEAHHRL